MARAADNSDLGLISLLMGQDTQGLSLIFTLLENSLGESFDSDKLGDSMEQVTGLARVPHATLDSNLAREYYERLQIWNDLYIRGAATMGRELMNKRKTEYSKCSGTAGPERLHCVALAAENYKSAAETLSKRVRTINRFFFHQSGVYAVGLIAHEILQTCSESPVLKNCQVEVKPVIGPNRMNEDNYYGLSSITVSFDYQNTKQVHMATLGLVLTQDEAQLGTQDFSTLISDLVWNTKKVFRRFRHTPANPNVAGVDRARISQRFLDPEFFSKPTNQMPDAAGRCEWRAEGYCLNYN